MPRSWLCLLGLSAFLNGYAVAAPANLWGAIASSYDTLYEAHGISNKSAYDAFQEALMACRKQAKGQDCFAIANVQNGCTAWAVDRQGHWGWSEFVSTSPSPEALALLQKNAIDHCSKNSEPDLPKCQVVRMICTGSNLPRKVNPAASEITH